MTEYDIYPLPRSYPLPTSDGAYKTLYVSPPETQTRLLFFPFHRSRIISWAAKCCLSTTWVALFSLKYPLFPSLFSFLSHPLIPAMPSSQHRAANLRQWQTPTRKPAILIPLCISIMEQLDMRALLSGPSWLTPCCLPSVSRERSGETQGGERRREGAMVRLSQQWD